MAEPERQAPLELVRRTVELALDWLPAEERERLARIYCSPSALRRRRVEECAGLLRWLALGAPAAPSGRRMAEQLHGELLRYAASAWRFERGRPPAEPRRAALHRILTLSGGEVPSPRSIRRALSGRGPKSGPIVAHGS